MGTEIEINIYKASDGELIGRYVYNDISGYKALNNCVYLLQGNNNTWNYGDGVGRIIDSSCFLGIFYYRMFLDGEEVILQSLEKKR